MTHHATNSPQKPTALITGAGQRIGAIIAAHLAAQGYDLVVHYHQSEVEAKALAARLFAEHGCTVTLKQADLADPAALERFWEGLPVCAVLIHNASRFTRDTLATMTAASLRAHLAINFESPLLLTQGFMTQIPTEKTGNIIVLGDGMMGWSIAPQFFSYAVSKHAWSSVIDVLAASCAPRVRANVIALGATLNGANDDEATFTRLAERAPLKRHGAPAEVLTAIDFLLSAPGITGQVISLANGFGLASARPV